MEQAGKQIVAIQSNKNNLLSKSPQQMLNNKSKLNEQDRLAQKNPSVFKQVDVVNPESLKTFCEDLNIDSNFETVQAIPKTNNDPPKVSTLSFLVFNFILL